MSAKIEYNGTLLKTVESGTAANLPVANKKMAGNIKVKVEKDAPNLQAKDNVTPTKSTQTITPDSGFEGLSRVTVGAIPEKYQDVSGLNADSSVVLAGKTFYGANGRDEGDIQAFQGGGEMHIFVSSEDPSKLNVVIERASAEQHVYLPARTNITGSPVSASSLDPYLRPEYIASEATIFGVEGGIKTWDGSEITIESL